MYLTLFAAAVATAPAPSSVQPRLHTRPTTVLESVVSDGGLRWYRTYVPPTAAAEGPRPLVVCFHGGGGSAQSAISTYGVLEEAARHEWIAVFPEGTGVLGGPPLFALQTWNGGECCGSAQENEIDDVQFFADMLAKLGAEHPIDTRRVFLTGMSNGAIMTYRIGVERPELVTAIAPVAGSLETAPPEAPLPILAVHGLLDENVPFGGGIGIGPSGHAFTSQLDSLLPFLAVNGGVVPAAPVVQGDALLFVSPGPADGADTAYLLALDGGHTWPGSAGSPIDPTEPVHTDVSATALMFAFFEAQAPDG